MPDNSPSPEPKTVSPFASWRVDHAGIRVPNFDAAIKWYTEVLDFRVLNSLPIRDLTFGFIAPAADDTFRIEILAGPGSADRPPYQDLPGSYNMSGWHHLGIRVDNVDAAIEELKRRGVKIVSEPHDVLAMGLRIAFFADPWGNLLEVIASTRE
jgi:catechol 2,3-dioxygenase-like lactoylglutathione lyase family enzyme